MVTFNLSFTLFSLKTLAEIQELVAEIPKDMTQRVVTAITNRL